MFASFWNRNHTLRTLQRAAKNYHAMLEAEKKVSTLHILVEHLLLADGFSTVDVN